MTALTAAKVAWSVRCADRWLVVRLGVPHAALSWAIVGGGHVRTQTVAFHQVDDSDLRPPVDPRLLFEERLARAGLSGSVGLLTSRRVDRYTESHRSWGPHDASAIATVGLGNALAVADPPGAAAKIGTINVLCRVSAPLTHAALIEALAIATEARAAAILASGCRSTLSGAPATGTGTDCIVIAAPDEHQGIEPYAGKHTAIGHLVGATVKEAVATGAAQWLTEHRAQVETQP